MSKKKQSLLVIVLIAAAITLGGWLANSSEMTHPDIYLSLKKNITLFQRVYEEIILRYVDEIDPDAFVKAGIEGMTSHLDPYTGYIEKEASTSLRFLTKGKYGGVGMTISKRGDYPVVEEPPFDGTPAAKAGIREGDQIIEVDGKSTLGMSLSEVAQRLRGKPGTVVRVKIHRAGENKPLEFRLVRDVIVIHDVSYAGMLQDGIGYIRLTRFSKFSADQVRESVEKLKSQGMKGLILDLRSNPGGLLDAAVAIVDLFVPKGELIVYTKGRTRQSNRKYYSQNDPILPDTPLAILVNGASASASEIVAGAIQDLDRGLIIGQQTYGKGLVQTVIPFSKNTGLRLTTAKYYIPSSRLIQNIARLNRDPKLFLTKDTELTADSTHTKKKAYHTKGGRLVYGGGGIKPDIQVDLPRFTNFERALIRQSMFFNFAVNFAAQFKEKKPERIEITPAVLKQFRDYLEEKHFTFQLEGEPEVDKLAQIAQENAFGPRVENDLKDLQASIERRKSTEFDRHVDFIKRYLKREIAAKLFGTEGTVKADLEDDPVLRTALRVLENPSEYAMKLGK